MAFKREVGAGWRHKVVAVQIALSFTAIAAFPSARPGRSGGDAITSGHSNLHRSRSLHRWLSVFDEFDPGGQPRLNRKVLSDPAGGAKLN
jgi:hypothetical protein